MSTAKVLMTALLVVTLHSCHHENSSSEKYKPMSAETIEQVMQAHTAEWMSIPGVVGVGIGECDGKPCIKIFAASSTPELARAVPDSIDGYKVLVQVTGEFKAHGDSAK